MPTHRPRTTRILLLLIILGGFTLRVVGLHDTSLWLDELIQVYMANKPLAEMLETMFNHINLPVDIFLSKILLQFGDQEGWLRLSAAFAGTLSLPLVYSIARRLVPAPAPILSMALLAFSPLAVQHSRELRPYSILLMLTLFSVLFFLLSLKQARYWPAFVIALLLTLHTHLFAIALVPVFGLYALIWCLKPLLGSGRRWAEALPLAMVGLVVLLYVASPFTPDYIGRVGAAVIAGLGQPDAQQLDSAAQVAYPFPGWTPLVKRLPYDFTGRWGEIPLNGALSVLGIALGVLGAFSLRRRPRALSFLLLWLVLPPAVILVTLSQRDHWFSPRYIIQALPAWLILVGAGLARLGAILDRWVGRRNKVGAMMIIPIGALAAAALYLILVVPSLAATFAEPHENIRAAAAYLRQQYQPGDLVVAPAIGRFLGHYLPPEIPVLDTGDSAIVELTGSGYDRVCVMQSRYSRLQAPDAPWLSPENALATFQPGIEIFRGPAGADATAYLDRRLNSTGDAPPTAKLRQLAAEARANQEWEKTSRYLEILLAYLPEDADVWAELGFAQQIGENYEGAIATYDEAIRLNSEHIWAHILAANSYRIKGDSAGGLAYARKAVELAPDQVAAWLALGNIQLSLDQPDLATESFSRGIALQEDDLASRYGYARASTALGLAGAPDAWLQVLSLNPPRSMIAEACRFLPADAHPACRPAQ